MRASNMSSLGNAKGPILNGLMNDSEVGLEVDVL